MHKVCRSIGSSGPVVSPLTVIRLAIVASGILSRILHAIRLVTLPVTAVPGLGALYATKGFAPNEVTVSYEWVTR